MVTIKTKTMVLYNTSASSSNKLKEKTNKIIPKIKERIKSIMLFIKTIK